MRLWLQRLLAMVALAGVLVASNLHLAVIQGIAWVRMYEHYRVGYPPALALEVTLSGKAPCNLCKFVQAAQKEQGKAEGFLTWTAKVLLPLLAAGMCLAPGTGKSERWSEVRARLVVWCAPPEIPPPRWA
ncbi:MAG: hypothetical protein ABSH19_07840 [Opitutales bacterium]|jgi:hypothetical protein